MVESGGWWLLGNKQHPCIHPGARLAVTNLEPCEEPVGQTSLTRRETTARKKTNIAPTLACDHGDCLRIVLVTRLVRETTLHEPARSVPQQRSYVRRTVPVRRACHSMQSACLHSLPQRLRTKPPFRGIPVMSYTPTKKKMPVNKRQLWRGGEMGGIWGKIPQKRTNGELWGKRESFEKKRE